MSRPERSLLPDPIAWVGLVTIASCYLGIIAIARASRVMAPHWGWAPWGALPLIAALQNHLQSLQHEGAHHQLHPNRRFNDWLADVFCSLPFFGLIRHYRHFHLAHHRHLLDSKRDPEVEFYREQGHLFRPKSPGRWAWTLFLDGSGYHYFQFFFSYNLYLWRETRAGRMPALSKGEVARGLGVWIVALSAVGAGHAFPEFAFYWLLPQPTVLFLFLKLQGYGEHGARTDRVETCTFNRRLGVLIRFFIYPLNSHQHRDHHLAPRLPWYRLGPSFEPGGISGLQTPETGA